MKSGVTAAIRIKFPKRVLGVHGNVGRRNSSLRGSVPIWTAGAHALATACIARRRRSSERRPRCPLGKAPRLGVHGGGCGAKTTSAVTTTSLALASTTIVTVMLANLVVLTSLTGRVPAIRCIASSIARPPTASVGRCVAATASSMTPFNSAITALEIKIVQ